jgi:transcriptional regulator with XRE-family HTH domain
VNALPNFAVNLRRLLAWHDLSGKEFARLIGATENSVSSWLKGKVTPGSKYVVKIEELFEAFKMFGDPDEFGQQIADPKRRQTADENIAKARRGQIKAV